MIDGLKYIRDLKAFARGDIQRSDLPRLEAELYGTNDRARVAMLGSFVDTLLQRFLKTQMRPVNSE